MNVPSFTSSAHRIAHVEAIALRVARPLAPHAGHVLQPNERGYLIDPDNGTIYPADDRTLLLRVTCEDGTVGWGETYGIVAAGAVRALIDDMATGKIDILIGTQMVTKGHHFPNLTLVGVIDADLGLAGGDLRAAERTYQVLTQVAGRAGRAAKKGQVLIQTVDPAQPLMQALAHGTTIAARDVFLAAQLRERQLFRMPPAGRLVALIIAGVDREQVERVAKEIGMAAPRGEAERAQGIQVLGPAPAPLAILRGRHRIRFLMKAGRDVKVQPIVAAWLAKVDVPKNVIVTVDIDPYSFM